jgi:plasmid stability protein
MDVLIRDLPAEVHAELTRRAAAEDKSLRAYLRQVLTEHVAAPAMDQWLEHVRELGPNHVSAPSGADLVAAARAEGNELIGR